MLAGNSTFSHERAAVGQEFFPGGKAKKIYRERRFPQNEAGTASALIGVAVDFNCRSSASTLFHSFGFRLVA